MYYNKKMSVPSQEYDSCCPFVWCVWAFDFAIWLGTFLSEFPSEFSIFVILLFTNVLNMKGRVYTEGKSCSELKAVCRIVQKQNDT